MRSGVAVVSALTALLSGWMTLMYFVLRHPDYLQHAAVSAAVCGGAATLLGGRPIRSLRLPTAGWGLFVAAVGLRALMSPGDDGWVIVAGLLFVTEGILSVT